MSIDQGKSYYIFSMDGNFYSAKSATLETAEAKVARTVGKSVEMVQRDYHFFYKGLVADGQRFFSGLKPGKWKEKLFCK